MTSFAQNGLLLDVQHVTMRFGGITAVNDLSMRIPTGSITGLIGRSEERRVGKECRSRWSPYH